LWFNTVALRSNSPYSTTTASTGQTCRQLSHRTQIAGSILNTEYGSPLIASTGHATAHFVQPMHLSLIE
jgi:hypothetical protein